MTTAILCVGGMGGHVANLLHDSPGLNLLVVDSDACTLAMLKAEKRMIGREACRGLGAGGDPGKGRLAAISALGELEGLLATDILYIVAGLGGGIGTGAAPVFANHAKERGAAVIALVTTPFAVETKRLEKAKRGLKELESIADVVIVFDNQKLVGPVNMTVSKAMEQNSGIVAATFLSMVEEVTEAKDVKMMLATRIGTL
jgi:cell division protein FtsZ